MIEDAFIEAINGDEKEAKKMDDIIDSIIDDRHEMLNKVSNYPLNESRAAIKEHFKAIKTNLGEKAAEYNKKIGIVG